ncbi:hypothetical protein Rsub_07115 [Raphidocelis subcapitata]|uniref:DUF4536 domain-containing protein n=1 Tax=Raphidocelis subcapitata TaxID=307507 RepID=A0A2V0P2M6_9CHLO|nr:hypothetical protein Rsub_07115 [Raphidocelis subcapitata]|eukprot:GBF94128.1 hypothetical protein Rsub_07115 [Raphidocelis subcapitata]
MAADGEGPCRICDALRDAWAAATGASKGARGTAQLPPPAELGVGAPPSPPAPPRAAAGGAAPAAASAPDARRADCLGCRLTGMMAGLGAAGYLSSALLESPPPRGAHRAALVAGSVALAGAGVARGFGWY